jgi:hypothetical protein
MWLWATTPDAGPEDLEVAGEAAQDSLALQMALAGAGMTYERYKEYLGALAIAKTDAGDPASLDIPLGDPMLSAEQDQALEDMREFYAIRKANLKVYQRMAARVEPLLVKMGM